MNQNSKDRPILFKTYMAKAIEVGAKTATRRVIKPKAETSWLFDTDWDDEYIVNRNNHLLDFSPYGQPFDTLWVRETFWQRGFYKETSDLTPTGKKAVMFIPDGQQVRFDDPYAGKNKKPHKFENGWHRRPSIFMPRWACKLELAINNIKVERLNALTDKDAFAEGVVGHVRKGSDETIWCHYGALRKTDTGTVVNLDYASNTPIGAFKLLWESINGLGSWDKNPWVWVTEFEILER